MKARKISKISKVALSLLLSAVMFVEPAAGSAIAYAAEPAGGLTMTVTEVDEDENSIDPDQNDDGGVDKEKEETDPEEEKKEETDPEEEKKEETDPEEEKKEETDPEEGEKEESEEENPDEEGSEAEEETENPDEVTEEENPEAEEETEETEAEEEDKLKEELEDEDNWRGSGHKAPKLEMNLSSAMVAEKRELVGTADRLERLKEDVQYVAHEAIFIADSKSYAEKVAKGYGATLDSYSDSVAIMSFPDEVTDIITMAEDDEVLLPAVYPNYIYTNCNEVEASVEEGSITAVYTDPFIPDKQYYHEVIHSYEAWEYNNAAGKGIKVAVLDSGIDKAHEDLKGRVSSASATHLTPYNGAVDNHAHGTHVSGIIAANVNNAVGGAGIANQASIVSIKVLENNPLTGGSNGSTAGIIKGINAAVKSGARVINMSLGGSYYDALYEASVDAAVDKGVVVVVAAGNDGKELSKDKESDNYVSPACFDNVITVSARSESSTALADFSNYGAGIIDMTAPGEDIYSTYPTVQGTYGGMSGTSQATPMVAAAAAYILSVSPDLVSNKSKATVDTVKSILQNSATKDGYSDSARYGGGLLNVEAAIRMAAPSSVENGGVGELQAPVVTIGGTEVANNQTIQDTDLIALSSMVEGKSSPEVKIYYTLDGKKPTEESTLYTGPFKLQASGNKTINAMAVYYGKKSKVTTIKVKVNSYVTGFNVTTKTKSNYLGAGKSVALVAGDFVPAYATNKKVKWEITDGADYATVSTSGKVSAKTNFTEKVSVTVKATALDKQEGAATASINLTLLPKVTAVKLKNPEDAKVTLEYPATKNMEVVVEPLASGASLSYTSSNAKIATVNASGKITAVGSGTATITAQTTDGSGKKATMKVTVVKKVQSITISSKTGDNQVAAGKSLQLVADVTSDATNKKVKWSVTEGGDYATISTGGKLSAKSASVVKSVSTVTVKAEALDGSNVSATKKITIYPSATNKIALENGTTCTLGTKNSGDLKTTVQLRPYTEGYLDTYYGRAKGSGATGLGNFTYTSSNAKVATVNETGLVTVKAVGTAKIKVATKDGSGKNVSCTIKVVEPVTAISVYSKNGLNVVGRNKTLTLGALTNSKASNKKVKWTSDNPSVATVDASGKVKGISYGSGEASTTIRATATDGSGTSTTFTVTVIPAITKLAYYTTRGTFANSAVATMGRWDYGYIGEFCPYYFDEISGDRVPRTEVIDGQTYRYFDWDVIDYSCSNYNVIQIIPDEDGYLSVCPVGKGKATLTFKALDGSGKSCKLTITVK